MVTQLISTAEDRQVFGYDVVILLALLTNYKKYEIVNPYVVKLSILDDELPLNGYGLVNPILTESFVKCGPSLIVV